MAVELHESFAIHPGPWLRDQVIKPYRMTVTSAYHLQVTWSALSKVMNGNARRTPLMECASKGIWNFGSNLASDADVARFNKGEVDCIVAQHR